MSDRHKILALATCYNRREKTENSIKKLVLGNPNIDFDFIIVDDNSCDGTKEMLKQFTNVNVVDGTGNLFYSGGMRKAIEEAKKDDKTYDYCLFFNDDVDFFPKSIQKLVSLKNKDRDIIVGATCNRCGQLTYAGVVKTSRWIPKCKIVFSENSEELIPCDTFNANCVLIDYTVFRRLNNIDQVYTHGMGDYDYGFEAKRKGYNIVVANFFCGECEETTEENSWRDRKLSRRERLKIKNTAKGTPNKEWFYYLKKNYNILTAIVYSISPYIRIILGV